MRRATLLSILACALASPPAFAAVDTVIYSDGNGVHQQDVDGRNGTLRFSSFTGLRDDVALGPAGEKIAFSTTHDEIIIGAGGFWTAFAGPDNAGDDVQGPHFDPGDAAVVFGRLDASSTSGWNLWRVGSMAQT